MNKMHIKVVNIKREYKERTKPPHACTMVRSSITIYLILMLVLIMALICTLIESGRVSAINTKLRSITFMGADSVFAEYVRPMFDEYGVMFLWYDEEEFTERLNTYISENIDISKTGEHLSVDIYGLAHMGSSLNEVTWATDNNGMVFSEQVCEYMKVKLAESAVEKILEETKLFGQSEKVSAFMEKIQKYKDTFIKVEQAAANVKAKADKVKSMAGNPKRILEEMESRLSGSETDTDGFSQNRRELIENKNELEENLNSIKEETKNYYDGVSEAKEAVSSLEQELSIEKEGYSDDVYEIVQGEIEDIKEKCADTDADYYNVSANETAVDEYLGKLDQLKGFLDATEAGVSEENADQYLDLTKQMETEFSDFNSENFKINYLAQETEKADGSFLETIDTIFDSGLLGYVAEDLSEKAVDTTDFPSNTVGKGKDTESNRNEESNSLESEISDVTAERVLCSEYVLEHFGYYTGQRENKVLDYEAEYVIGGKKSDRENLEAVINKIILIRTGLNMISIFKDAEKKEATLLLATAIIGFTGIPVLIKLVQMLIISAWALAESIGDMKTLLKGEKVATIKSEGDWNLSLEKIQRADVLGSEGKASEKGLGYRDYLRILLLTEKRQKQSYRTMDMIQANLCAEENRDFRMKDCMAAVKIDVEYKSVMLFTSFAFVNKYLKTGNGKYTFRFTQEYGY